MRPLSQAIDLPEIYHAPATGTLGGVGDDIGRRRHYAGFYGMPEAASGDDRPLWIVVGNCQAEALRLVLDSASDRPYRTVRIPPVHELQRSDLPHLDALLSQAAILLSQPVRADYRDLPIGTSQLAERLSPSGRCIRWPVIRYAGLYPFQAIVRHPADRSVVPPVVPYHDLRTVAAARAGRHPGEPWDVEVTADQIRAVADFSRDQLAIRERRDCDVAVSDVLAGAGAEAAHTINHPGNPVLEALGRRILDHAGVPPNALTIARTLLGSVYAPLETRALSAHGIDAAPRTHWVQHGETIAADHVHDTQLSWYQLNSDYLDLAVDRHGAVMDILGLLTSRATA